MSPLATSSTTAPRIGVAIAVHNSWDVLADCLKALNASVTEAELSVVVCDDGSTDGTREELAAQFPSVRVVTGDGSLWWTGGTNRAVELCLVDGCDYVLLLNPDAFVAPGAIQRLLECSTERDDAVCAGLVVDRDAPEHIVWAGSRWGRVVTPLPVWTSRYIYRRGTEVASIPLAPYETSEVHGRGVLFPAAVMRRSGLPDDVGMPHLGGDTEYSRHLDSCGVRMFIVPSAIVTLETRTSSMGMTGSAGAGWSFRDARSRFQRHLWDRKSGEQMSVWWTISRRHVPWYGALPTFGFIIGLGSFRFWQRELRQARRKTTGGSSR
jgi:GT2 family glycosyltransferase